MSDTLLTDVFFLIVLKLYRESSLFLRRKKSKPGRETLLPLKLIPEEIILHCCLRIYKKSENQQRSIVVFNTLLLNMFDKLQVQEL